MFRAHRSIFRSSFTFTQHYPAGVHWTIFIYNSSLFSVHQQGSVTWRWMKTCRWACEPETCRRIKTNRKTWRDSLLCKLSKFCVEWTILIKLGLRILPWDFNFSSLILAMLAFFFLNLLAFFSFSLCCSDTFCCIFDWKFQISTWLFLIETRTLSIIPRPSSVWT
jgi:hypothetical protein